MTDGWAIFSAWATAGGAVATAVSAAIIARQAVQTTRTLRLAARERMDNEMPKLTITVGPTFSLYRRYTEGDGVNTWAPIAQPAQEEFERPAADDIVLRVQFRVILVNAGPRDALVHIEKMPFDMPPSNILVATNAEKPKTQLIQVDRTVAQWAALSDAEMQSGNRSLNSPELVLSVQYRFPGDYGATETHSFHVIGSVLRASSKPNTYQLFRPGSPGATFAVHAAPFTRIYWESRSANRELGAPWWQRRRRVKNKPVN